jgi:hypothetical protein
VEGLLFQLAPSTRCDWFHARVSYVCRGAGIGTPEAIKLVWSCHREIIADHGPIAADWTTPPPS